MHGRFSTNSDAADPGSVTRSRIGGIPNSRAMGRRVTGSSCERPVAVLANRVASTGCRALPVGFCVFRAFGVTMSAVLLVPLLPLIATLIVGVGSEATRHVRAKIAAWPIGAAFCGAIATLYVVATEGPITLRLYDPVASTVLAVPIGLYIDRLSAVMMVLISGIGTIIYTGDQGHGCRRLRGGGK